jgi:O-antigen ligase
LWSGRKKTIILSVLFAATAVCTFVSEHETSKLALIVASVIFLIALVSARAAKGLMIAGWIIAILGTVPIALFAYNGLKLHEAKWVQYSGRDRIVIWADIAERTFEHPVLGVGARTTNQLNDLGTTSLLQPDANKKRKIGRHPHSVYLQAWYELGGVGALLLGVAGLVAFAQVLRFPAFTWPFSFAMLSTMALELALCWDIWQRWFFALLCFSAVTLVLALRWVTLRKPQGAPGGGSA